MTFIDLFSGIGGFSLGLERAGMTCIGQVEIDPYCLKVLAKHWPDVPRHEDIHTFRGDEFGTADLICAGVPCQPHSHAGRRQGARDPRNLWPEFMRVVRYVRPRWVLVENVVGFLSTDSGRFFAGVLRDLAACGYDAHWECLPAAAFGAPHIRDRVFILAYAAGRGPYEESQTQCLGRNTPHVAGDGSVRAMADPDGPDARRQEAHGRPCAGDADGRAGAVADATGSECRMDGGRHGGGGGQAWQSPDAPQPTVLRQTDRTIGAKGISASRSYVSDPEGSGRRPGRAGRPAHGGTGQPESERAFSPTHTDTHPNSARRQGERSTNTARGSVLGADGQGPTQPDLGRMFDGLPPGLDRHNAWLGDWEQDMPRVAVGIPNRTARLRALGNAVVPAVVQYLGEVIMTAEGNS